MIAIVGWFVLRPAPPGVAAEARPAPPAAAPVNGKSIAVLPFENMSEEKDSLFFTDGIHEDILTNLALIRELHVISRTSVMQYRGTTKPIRQIASELRVAYVLEGSVRRAGSKVRGRLSSRLSTCRDNCDSARIGMLSSLASALSRVVISVISCTRFSAARRLLKPASKPSPSPGRLRPRSRRRRRTCLSAGRRRTSPHTTSS